MACALPVVSVVSEELKRLDSPAFLARDKYEFVAMIKQALASGPTLKKAAVEFARENTWEKRFAKINELIANKLR